MSNQYTGSRSLREIPQQRSQRPVLQGQRPIGGSDRTAPITCGQTLDGQAFPTRRLRLDPQQPGQLHAATMAFRIAPVTSAAVGAAFHQLSR